MDFQDPLTSIDTPRKNGYGLKNTSLSVLAQKKTHKTQTQKNFEQYNRQRMTMTLNNAQVYQSQAQAQAQSQSHLQTHERLQRPRFHKSSAESMRSQTSNPSQGNQQLYQQKYYPASTDSFAPVQPVLPHQSSWADSYERSDSIGAYSPTSSDFTFEDGNKFTSPDTSHNSDWRESSQSTTGLEKEMLELKQELIRLKLVETENLRLTTENESLTHQLDSFKLENSRLVREIEASQHQYTSSTELTDKEEQLAKTLKLCEELEIKFTDTTQQLNKSKLVHKTNMDMKTREINRLKEDLKELEELYAEQSIESIDKTTILMDKEVTTPKKETVQQQPQQQQASTDLIQDLLYTIKTLKSHKESLTRDKQRLVERGEMDRRILRALAHSSRNKVKIRKGLTLVSEIDTLI